MDPTALLKQALMIADRIVRHADDPQPYSTLRDDATALAERVNQLNDWLSRGNALPAQWRHRGES